MGKMVLMNGKVVTGDGITLIETGSVVIEEDRIAEVIGGHRKEKDFEDTDEKVDAEGFLIMPGVINHHTHGIMMGPLYPSAASALGWERVKYNLDKHLLEGTTTLLSVCGFASMDEIEEVNRKHPINIKTGLYQRALR